MKLLTCVLTMLAALTSSGGTSLGSWSGEGTSFDPASGAAITGVHVELTRTDVGGGVVITKGRAVTQDGHELPFAFKVAEREGGGEVTTAVDGRCYGDGLCEVYQADDDGCACVLTFVVDADGSLRLILTQLKEGKPVRVTRVKVAKAS